MDGFKIKVFLDNNTPSKRNALGKTEVVKSLVHKKVGFSSKVVEGKTFKDALMDYSKKSVVKLSEGCEGEATVGSLSKDMSKVSGSILVEPIQIEVEEGDKSWLKNCLVGQLSAMYDAVFVQQVLCSEGFKVKTWFDDVDTVENFTSSQKLRVWLSIEGLPLGAWSVSVLNRIASRWRKIIKIDPEKVARTRLDRVRILMGLIAYVFPPFLPIVIDSSVRILKLSYAEYEDDRCWINSEKVKSCHESAPESPCFRVETPCMGNRQGDGLNTTASNVELIADSPSVDLNGKTDTCSIKLNNSDPPHNGPLASQALLGPRGLALNRLKKSFTSVGKEKVNQFHSSGCFFCKGIGAPLGRVSFVGVGRRHYLALGSGFLHLRR
ncbi:hypothetical protein V6N11_023285 [Hibiscus sabdariffa]|uniref:DUF4283 domain-containing protein n=1 Tax=Hibiscus sabdariffa TaxID=183260 RepID=A0ABR2TLY8_9ROSI